MSVPLADTCRDSRTDAQAAKHTLFQSSVSSHPKVRRLVLSYIEIDFAIKVFFKALEEICKIDVILQISYLKNQYKQYRKIVFFLFQKSFF